jgi:hypothetical protein
MFTVSVAPISNDSETPPQLSKTRIFLFLFSNKREYYIQIYVQIAH